MKKANKYWQEQLNQAMLDGHCGYDDCEGCNRFGDMDYATFTIQDARAYIGKIEKLGGTEIKVPDNSTISCILPESTKKANELLLFILTYQYKPGQIKHHKQSNKLTMRWSY